MPKLERGDKVRVITPDWPAVGTVLSANTHYVTVVNDKSDGGLIEYLEVPRSQVEKIPVSGSRRARPHFRHRIGPPKKSEVITIRHARITPAFEVG